MNCMNNQWNLCTSGTAGEIPPFAGLNPQRIHHAGNVNILWAARSTCLATRAQPDGLAFQNRWIVKLQAAHDLVGRQVKLVSQRTTAGTFNTLVAAKNILSDVVQHCF